MLHPFHTPRWNLDHFKLYNSKIICYPFPDQFKRLSFKRELAHQRPLVDVDRGMCVCASGALFFLSWLALAVKAAVLVISWLALQGKKILIFAACGREDVIMLLSHLTDRHLCWTHSMFHLRALNEYPSSPLPRPAHLYLQCSLLFLPGLQSLPFVPPSWQLMPPHLTSHWWILSVKKPK